MNKKRNAFFKISVLIIAVFTLLKLTTNILSIVSRQEFLLLLFFDIVSFCYYHVSVFMRNQIIKDLRKQNINSNKTESFFNSMTTFFNTYVINFSIFVLQTILILNSPFL